MNLKIDGVAVAVGDGVRVGVGVRVRVSVAVGEGTRVEVAVGVGGAKSGDEHEVINKATTKNGKIILNISPPYLKFSRDRQISVPKLLPIEIHCGYELWHSHF